MQTSNYVIGIIIGFLIICIVVLAIGVFIKLYTSKIKNYNHLLYQKELDQQKAITETVIETQENTLEIISKELHDDAGQQLTYINLQVEQLKVKQPELKDALTPISKSIGHLSDSVRNLSHTISNQNIKYTKLTESIQNELNRLNRLKVVQCSLKVETGFNYNFSETERIILFRMFQEISNNMLKHSRANTYQVTISNMPKLMLSFKDDGCGFDFVSFNMSKTNGLLNLKQRAALLGYDITFNTARNKGTEIRLTKV